MQIHAADKRDILKALLSISNLRVPRSNLNCEINGTSVSKGGKTIYNDVTVGDFVADYVAWALKDISKRTQAFECEGKNLLKCDWGYGEKEIPGDHPGWNIFFRFTYDETERKVDPNSLKCIQVP